MYQKLYFYFISDESYNYWFFNQDDFMYLNKIYYQFLADRYKNNEFYNARQTLMKNLNYIIFYNEQSNILQQQLFISFYFEYKHIILTKCNHYYQNVPCHDLYRFSHLNYMSWLNLPNLFNNSSILHWRWEEKKIIDIWWSDYDKYSRTKWDMQVDHKERIDKYNLYFYTFDNPINVSYFSEYNYILLYFWKINWRVIRNKKYFKKLRKRLHRIYIYIYISFYKYIYPLFLCLL